MPLNPFGFLFPPACPICGTVLKKTGHDIRDYNRADLRDAFGMVLQDTWRV